MGIIWVVEKPLLHLQSIASSLIGEFPVRCIASVDSFSKLLKISKCQLPKIIIFNMSEISHFADEIKNLVNLYAPNSICVFRSSENIKTEDRTIPNIDQMIESSVFRLDVDMNLLEVSRHLKRITSMAEASENYASNSNFLTYKDIEFDCDNYEFQIVPGGEKENLPMKEARLLKFFMENPGKCLTRDAIRNSVWSQVKVASRTIDSHISRLRKRISYGEVNIESIYGGGYILK